MFTLAAWLHDIDPVAFTLPFGFSVKWYGLAYIAGFLFAWGALERLARRRRIRLEPGQPGDLVLAAMVGVIIGGRLGYVLFYQASLLTDFSGGFPWWGVLRINEGGMSSHGGMLGLLLGALWAARKFRISPLHLLDCLVLVAPVGVFLGRIANFVNGELLGRIVALAGTPAPPWSVKYPQELRERFSDVTPQAREGLSRLIEDTFPLTMAQERLTYEHLDALTAAVQHGNAEVAARLAPLINARHPSQLYQAAMEGIVVGMVMLLVWRRPRKPGTAVAWFCISYGIGRIATEFVRLPDAHLGAAGRFGGLSRGQWLSIGLVVTGAAILMWALRVSREPRNAPLFGPPIPPPAAPPTQAAEGQSPPAASGSSP